MPALRSSGACKGKRADLTEISDEVSRTAAQLDEADFEMASGPDDTADLAQNGIVDEAAAEARPKAARLEQFDEDGMDDFIEDDLNDQRQIMSSERADAYEEEGAGVKL